VDTALFEATHGSAPKYKGQNKVNPTALILSGLLMLKYLKETEAAAKLEKAVSDVIAEGKDVTYDMKPDRNDPTAGRHCRDGRRHHCQDPGRVTGM
jgi:isocitrate dehydrogenase (NAD+)